MSCELRLSKLTSWYSTARSCTQRLGNETIGVSIRLMRPEERTVGMRQRNPSTHATWAITMFVGLSLACSGATASPACEPDTIESTFVGTWSHESQSSALSYVGSQDTTTIGSQAFSDLKAVLGNGASASPGSVVWSMQHPSGTGLLLIQLAGDRAVGATLPVIGAITVGLPWGKAGAISAIVRDGAVLLFIADGYRAAQASGHLIVRSIKPLHATLDASLVSDLDVPAHLQGDIIVRFYANRPGC